MDNLTEFFKEFKSRLTNPLFASFIISWLIINWRVPIGFFCYKLTELKVDGYTSYSDLIVKNASTWHYLWHPLIYALGYTFVFPIIRMLITAFLSYIKKKSDNWNILIMKDYYVPMPRFVKQKSKYDELAEALNKIYIEDKETVEENNKLKGEILALNNQISGSALEIQEFKNKKLIDENEITTLKNKTRLIERKTNTTIIYGRWQMTIAHKNQPESHYDVMIAEDQLFLEEKEWGNLYMIQCNYDEKRIFIAAGLKDYVSLILADISEQKISLLTLSIRYTSEEFKIFSMEGIDSYGTSYNFKLLE